MINNPAIEYARRAARLVSCLCTVLFLPAMASAQAVPFYDTAFEPSAGYTPGSLHGQSGWSVDEGAASVVVDSLRGEQLVVLQPATSRTTISRDFSAFDEEDVVFVDFSLRGAAGEPPSDAPEASSPGTFYLAIAAEGDRGRFYVFEGDGSGNGMWTPTAATVPIDSDGQLLSWVNVTVRLDYVRQSFDVYSNGTIAGYDYGFLYDDQEAFTRFILSGNPQMEVLLDDFYASPFPVAWDNEAGDGIPDWWKSQHSLDLESDIRDEDPNGDGLTNLETLFAETSYESATTTEGSFTTMSSSGGDGELVFIDDFESGTLGNWSEWSAGSGLQISTAQNNTSGGQYSALLTSSAEKMSHSLAAPIHGATSVTFWVYDDMGAQTRWYGEARSGFSQLFAIGRYDVSFGTGTGELENEVPDTSKYQGRVLAGDHSGWFNLDAPGAPSRSSGWREFEIRRLADRTTVEFYVDGVLGRTITGVDPAGLDTLAIGSIGFGSTVGDAWFDDIELRYYSPPTINDQPEHQTLSPGGTATFSVDVSSTSTVEYQWKRGNKALVDDGRIQGANTAQLLISDINQVDHGRYTVEISTPGGSMTSDFALLSVEGKVVLFDDFEDNSLSKWTTVPGWTSLEISDSFENPQAGNHTAHLYKSRDKMYHNLGTAIEGPARATFWIYDNGGSQTRWFGEIRGYDKGIFSPDNEKLHQVLAIGKYHVAFDRGTGMLETEVVNPNKYQARVGFGQHTGWFNLDAPGSPDVAVGWRKFEIERMPDGTTINFYVDGILSRTITETDYANWDVATMGSIGQFGSVVVDGDVWFDDIAVEYFQRGHWPLTDGAGSIAVDLSEFENDGVLSATGLGWSGDGHGVEMDGTGEILIGDPQDGSLDLGFDSVTISTWFRSTATEWQALVSKGGHDQEAGYALGLAGGTTPGSIFATLGGPGLKLHIHTIDAFNDGQWHHALAVFNRKEEKARIYVNGIRRQIASGFDGVITGTDTLDFAGVSGPTGPIATSSRDFYIGAIADGNGNAAMRFDGAVAEARVYGFAVTDSDIDAIYGVDSSDSGIPDWWKLHHFGDMYKSAGDAAPGDSSLTLLEAYRLGRDPNVASVYESPGPNGLVGLEVFTVFE